MTLLDIYNRKFINILEIKTICLTFNCLLQSFIAKVFFNQIGKMLLMTKIYDNVWPTATSNSTCQSQIFYAYYKYYLLHWQIYIENENTTNKQL